MASGFGSLRRFNDVFKKQYKLYPTALRKQAGNEKQPNRLKITLALGISPSLSMGTYVNFLATPCYSWGGNSKG